MLTLAECEEILGIPIHLKDEYGAYRIMLGIRAVDFDFNPTDRLEVANLAVELKKLIKL